MICPNSGFNNYSNSGNSEKCGNILDYTKDSNSLISDNNIKKMLVI